MTNAPLKIISGIWYDSDGFVAEEGAKFPLFISDGKAEDDLHLQWTVDGDGNLVSDQSIAYFAPDKGELSRVGLM